MKINRLCIAFFMLCLSINFAGCSTDERHESSSDVDVAISELPAEEPIYKTRSLPLPEENFLIADVALDDTSIYIYGKPMIPPEGWFPGIYIYDLNGNQKGFVALTNDEKYDRSIMNIYADGLGNVWALEWLREFDVDGVSTKDEISSWCVERYSIDGTVKEITVSAGDAKYTHMIADYNYIYIVGENGLNVFDHSGNPVMEETVPNISAIFFADGAPYLAYTKLDEIKIQRVDLEQRKLAEILANSFSGRFFDGGAHDFYVDSKGFLYGAAINGDMTEICDFTNFDFAKKYKNIYAMNDGKFMVSTALELILLYPSELSASEIKFFSLGTMDARTIAKDVEQFNAENDAYQVKIIDYSKYNLSPNSNEGIIKLNTEIISGKGPDILDLTSLPANTYIKSGLLQDLYPFIQRDPETKNLKFVEPVQKIIETDGKLYTLIPGYAFKTLVGNGKYFDNDKLRVEELMESVSRMENGTNPFGTSFSQRDFFELIMSCCIDEFINYDSLTCEFDTPLFKQMLQFASTMPKDKDGSSELQMIGSEEQIVTEHIFTGYHGLIAFDYYFGGNMQLLGLPASETPGAAVCPYVSLGISTNCKDKEGAWMFLRTFLMSAYQKNMADLFLPISEDAMDYKRSQFSLWCRESGVFSLMDATGNQVELNVQNSRPSELMEELIDSASGVYYVDEPLFNIVWENVDMYLNSERSLEQTISVINSKVGIYVAEQFG